MGGVYSPFNHVTVLAHNLVTVCASQFSSSDPSCFLLKILVKTQQYTIFYRDDKLNTFYNTCVIFKSTPGFDCHSILLINKRPIDCYCLDIIPDHNGVTEVLWFDRPTLNAFSHIYHLFRIRCQSLRPIRLPQLHERIEGSRRVVYRREWPLRFIPPLAGPSLPPYRQSNHALHSVYPPCREPPSDVECQRQTKTHESSGIVSTTCYGSRTGNKIYFRRHKFYGRRPAKGRWWTEAHGTSAVDPPERVVIGPTTPSLSYFFSTTWTRCSHTSDTDWDLAGKRLYVSPGVVRFLLCLFLNRNPGLLRPQYLEGNATLQQSMILRIATDQSVINKFKRNI